MGHYRIEVYIENQFEIILTACFNAA